MGEPTTYVPGGIKLPIGTPATVKLPPMHSVARMTGLLFETDKAFLLPSAIPGIRKLRKIYDEHPKLAVLVNGHTDRVGGPDYNLALSEERAASIAAYLKDDVDAWMKWYGAGVQESKRWGVREDQYMLTIVGGFKGPVSGAKTAAYTDAVTAFQKGAGLEPDGKCGTDTRKALVKKYMQQDETTLPSNAVVKVHGCGEFHNEKPTADGVEEPANRRVEVYFFDGAVEPAPPAKCKGPKGCDEWEKWKKQVTKTIDLDHDDVEPKVRKVFVRSPGSKDELQELTTAAGSDFELGWEVEDADKVQISEVDADGNDLPVTTVEAGAGGKGAHKLKAGAGEKKYLVYALHSKGSVFSPASPPVTVKASDGPRIVQFSAPKNVQSGKPVPIKWVVGGQCASIEISGEGFPKGFDPKKLKPQSGIDAKITLPAGTDKREVTWTLVAKPRDPANKEATATLKVTIFVPAKPVKTKPKIERFTVEPNFILSGEKATVTWAVIGETDSIDIGIDDDIKPKSVKVKKAAPTGSFEIEPKLKDNSQDKEDRHFQLFVTPKGGDEGDDELLRLAQIVVGKPSPIMGTTTVKGEWEWDDKKQPKATWGPVEFKFTPYGGFKAKVKLGDSDTIEEAEAAILGKKEIKGAVAKETHVEDGTLWSDAKVEKIKSSGGAKVDLKKHSAEVFAAFEFTFRQLEFKVLETKVKIVPKVSLELTAIKIKQDGGKWVLDKPGVITTKGGIEIPFGKIAKEKFGLKWDLFDFTGFGGLKLKIAPDWLKIATEIIGLDAAIALGLVVVAVGTVAGVVMLGIEVGNFKAATEVKGRHDAYLKKVLSRVEEGLKDTTFEDLQATPNVPPDAPPEERGFKLGQFYRGELLERYRTVEGRKYVEQLQESLKDEEPAKREEIIASELKGNFRNELDAKLGVAVKQAKEFARLVVREQFYLGFCKDVGHDPIARDHVFRDLYLDGRGEIQHFDYDFPDVSDEIFVQAMADQWASGGLTGFQGNLEAHWKDAGYDTIPPDAGARHRKQAKRTGGDGQIVDVSTGATTDDPSQVSLFDSLRQQLADRGVTIRKTWSSTKEMGEELVGTQFQDPKAWGKGNLHVPNNDRALDCVTPTTTTFQPVLAKIISSDRGIQWAMLDISPPAWVDLKNVQS